MGPPVPLRIPWSAIREWCEFHIEPMERVGFFDDVFADLDSVFFEHYAARVDKPAEGKI